MTHQEYFDKLTDSIDTLSDILDTEHYGMCLVDKDGYIIKWYYEKFFNIKASAAVGRHVTEVIENTRLHVVAQTGVKELMQLQEINGSMVITNRIPLIHNHEVIGAAGTIIFRDIKEIAHLHSRMSKLEDNFKAYRSEIAKMYAAQYHFDDIITNNQKMLNLKHLGQTIARSDASVLIQGESGTGKELFAQAIHNASARKNGPFIAVNCAALTETLLESELFGYAEGAFTGAKKGGKPGLFECAHQGSLFLDEIETMSPALQAKLLRVLQEREVVRIGSIDPIPVDVRILSSTNEDLLSRVQQGSFRRDLYYRLNVIPLHIPALRERREDILLLAETFCRQLGADFTISGRAQAALVQHRWPGNVRELRNCMEYLLHMGRSVADLEDLPEQFHVRRFAPPAGEDELLPQEWSVMRVLGELYPQRRGLGRVGIVRACADQGVPISEHEVRLALQTLEAGGWLSVGRGRGGTRLSDAGYRHYRELLNQRTDC